MKSDVHYVAGFLGVIRMTFLSND